jgi:hypothetical protein
MVDSRDMSTSVTRGELREELAQLEIRLEEKLEQKLAQKLVHLATKAELVPLATKVELEHWGSALLTRIELGEQRLIQRMAGLEQSMAGIEQRLLVELARHVKAVSEDMSRQISIIDEKYGDLPSRVRRLETEVFPPGRR